MVFQNHHLAFYLQQIDKLNCKSKLKLELFGSNFFPQLELELFSSNFCFRAGTGAFRLYFFPSELELEPQSSGVQIGAGSKSEPIVHLCLEQTNMLEGLVSYSAFIGHQSQLSAEACPNN